MGWDRLTLFSLAVQRVCISPYYFDCSQVATYNYSVVVLFVVFFELTDRASYPVIYVVANPVRGLLDRKTVQNIADMILLTRLLLGKP